MKPPHHHCRWKLHLLLTWALLLSSAQSTSNDSSNALEDGRQIQSPIPTPSDHNAFLLDEGNILTLDFLPYEKKSFLYYSNRDDTPIQVVIRLAVAYKEAGENPEETIKATLRQSQMVKGRYWPEKGFEGEGQEQAVPLALEPWINYLGGYNGTHLILNCNFNIRKGQKGKYLIEITNLWEFNIELGVGMIMSRSDVERSRPSQNFEDTDAFWFGGPQKTYDILMGTPGTWYFSVFTCGLPVNITIESVNKVLHCKPLENGGYLYKETIENKSIDAREDRWRTVIMTIPSDAYSKEDCRGKIDIYSMAVNDPEFMNFELEEDPKEMIVTENYDSKDSQIYPIVQFEPLKFKGFNSTGEIEYQIELFLKNPEANCEKGLMTDRFFGSSSIEKRVPIDQKEPIALHLTHVSDPFFLYIRITAFIVHGSHKIKYLTYPIGYVSGWGLIWRVSHIGIGVAGLVSLIFVVITMILCMKGFKKVGHVEQDQLYMRMRERVDENDAHS